MCGGRKKPLHKKPLALWHFLQEFFPKLGERVEVLEKNEYKKLINVKKDIIVAIGIRSFFPVLLKKIGLIKIPVIHLWNDDYYKCGGKGGKFLRKKMEHWIVNNSDLNITCSKFRENKAKCFGSKIKYIPHGVIEDFDRIKPSQKLKGKIKVVYGGEISKRKGIDKVVETAKKNPEVEFYNFGGSIKPDMRKILESKPKNFHLMGKVQHKELISYYKAADILILATDNDSTLKMFEYIKAGKPILALNNQVKYVLEHKKTAYLTNDLDKGLKELLENKKLREEISKNLKEYKVYTWKEVSEMYLEEIKNFLNEYKK